MKTEKYFKYLDELNKTGMNMFTARVSLLEKYPKLLPQEAKEILLAWLNKESYEWTEKNS